MSFTSSMMFEQDTRSIQRVENRLMEISCIFLAEQHEQTTVATMDPLHTLHGATQLLPNFFWVFICMVLIFLGKGGLHFRLQARRVVTLECWGPVCVSLFFFSPFIHFYMHVYSNETSCMSRCSE